MIKLSVPRQMYEALELDSSRVRNAYSMINEGGYTFSAPVDGWRRAIDNYRLLSWEAPEEQVESCVRKVEQWIEYCEAIE